MSVGAECIRFMAEVGRGVLVSLRCCSSPAAAKRRMMSLSMRLSLRGAVAEVPAPTSLTGPVGAGARSGSHAAHHQHRPRHRGHVALGCRDPHYAPRPQQAVVLLEGALANDPMLHGASRDVSLDAVLSKMASGLSRLDALSIRRDCAVEHHAITGPGGTLTWRELTRSVS
jgi:hypothetical protein